MNISKLSNEQIVKLQELYKKHFDVDLTFEEAKDAARRLITVFLPTSPVDDALLRLDAEQRRKDKGRRCKLQRRKK